MSKKDKVNSVFPVDEFSEEPDVTEPLKLPRSTAQNPKILRHDWQLLALAEPRDNKNFSPPNGSLHKSSYLRLGQEKPETGISETHKRLKEVIDSKDEDRVPAAFPHRSALNIFSHNLTEDQDRKDTLRSSGFELYPDDYGSTDYRTTSRTEYPSHFPINPRPSPPEAKPWLFYRRTKSYRDEELCTRDCGSKFFDEEMNTHKKISLMKIERYRSYDPIAKKFTEPRELVRMINSEAF